jgi:predicted neuraminidase
MTSSGIWQRCKSANFGIFTNNVHALMRSTGGRIARCDSKDGGKTWGKVYKTSLPNNNSGIDLVKNVDGVLWLVYNPVSINRGPRNPLTLAFSKDNGNTWNNGASRK